MFTIFLVQLGRNIVGGSGLVFRIGLVLGSLSDRYCLHVGECPGTFYFDGLVQVSRDIRWPRYESEALILGLRGSRP